MKINWQLVGFFAGIFITLYFLVYNNEVSHERVNGDHSHVKRVVKRIKRLKNTDKSESSKVSDDVTEEQELTTAPNQETLKEFKTLSNQIKEEDKQCIDSMEKLFSERPENIVTENELQVILDQFYTIVQSKRAKWDTLVGFMEKNMHSIDPRESFREMADFGDCGEQEEGQLNEVLINKLSTLPKDSAQSFLTKWLSKLSNSLNGHVSVGQIKIKRDLLGQMIRFHYLGEQYSSELEMVDTLLRELEDESQNLITQSLEERPYLNTSEILELKKREKEVSKRLESIISEMLSNQKKYQ
ncbi:MAG: hypothetical protein H6621_03185 [Halobacteriovoraceae bacterium]|nr:hypothetical protein [Halobacteriovoraceae bacterium]MCB9094050.1 hypothetical protein [Halobacteriovoraceae bacterium]